MVTTSAPDRPRIDEFLPIYDLSASYEIRIGAPPPVVYQCLLRSDLNKPWLVRLLMTIRTGKRPPRNRVPSDLRQRLHGTGFVILAEIPNEEMVIGIVGKFWRPDGGRCLGLTASDFVGFSRLGYAKVALEFQVQNGVAFVYGAFNRNADQVLRFGIVEVSPLLELGQPVLRLDTKGNSQAGKDRSRGNSQKGFLKIAKYRNSSIAIPLSTLLTACNAPQRASRRPVSADRLSSVGLSNRLLVGKITMSVNGMTDPNRTPAISYQKLAPASHAAMEDSSPKAAELACMIVARR